MEVKKYSGEDIDKVIDSVTNFLFKHLEEYGDKLEDIRRCAVYARDKGGKVIIANKEGQIVGAVILNETGMSGYIPENMLVYIAVNSKIRGEGIGKKLMEESVECTEGDIALHVEKDNPARFLYEKVGFTNPYLEMRYKRK